MRYSLTVDLEDDDDIRAFLEFVDFHSKRLKCMRKDVLVKLAAEWKKATALEAPKEEAPREARRVGRPRA